MRKVEQTDPRIAEEQKAKKMAQLCCLAGFMEQPSSASEYSLKLRTVVYNATHVAVQTLGEANHHLFENEYARLQDKFDLKVNRSKRERGVEQVDCLRLYSRGIDINSKFAAVKDEAAKLGMHSCDERGLLALYENITEHAASKSHGRKSIATRLLTFMLCAGTTNVGAQDTKLREQSTGSSASTGGRSTPDNTPDNTRIALV